jgi:autotransporter-associated beta strand protein
MAFEPHIFIICVFQPKFFVRPEKSCLMRPTVAVGGLLGVELRKISFSTASTAVWFALSITLGCGPAVAQNATWDNPATVPGPVLGTFDYNAAANWTPATVPTDIALFNASSTSNLSFSQNTTVREFSFNSGASNYTFDVSGAALTFNGIGLSINSGSATFSGGQIFFNSGTAATATFNGSIIQFLNSSTAANAVINNTRATTGLAFFNNATAGNATITNLAARSAIQFSGTSTAGNATITNSGTGSSVSFFNGSTAANATLTNSGADSNINFESSPGFFSTAGNATIINGGANSTVGFLGNATGGNASISNTSATAMVDVSLSTGPNGDNKVSAGSIAGGGFFYLGSDQLTVGGNNTSTQVSGIISDCGAGTDCQNAGATGGSLVKAGAGTLTLAGINTYTGATTVSGGGMEVDGSIASSSGVTVNNTAVLSGTGTVSTTTVNNGGTLMPGNGTPGTSLAVSGNLAFQSGALYLVQVDPSVASSVNVTGATTLNGATVNAAFANGNYISKKYTILTSGSINGTFGTLVNINLPANFHDSLSYDATHAYLDLQINFGLPGRLNGNQQAVGNALTNYFNATGGIPAVYAMLTAAQLTQSDGELATGSQQTTFDAMSMFMSLLTDPSTGRGGSSNGAMPAPGYAEESASAYAAQKRLGVERDAYAMFTKAPLAKVYEPRWSVWTAGYGGSQSTSGNAVVGSSDTTSRIAGTAVGADYLFSPNTLAGFALAGGGTNFSVNNLGTGRSDLFQAGAYVRHTTGSAYITGALAYGWQDITTDRTLTIAGIDRLRAEFNANAYSGRVEGGYRFVAPWIGGVGITPYAAGQFTTFDLPTYVESAVAGTPGFALAYAAKSVTDARSELGIRADKSFAMSNGILALRGRFAWSHDYDPDRSIAATFQALPGASFVVNGAAQASDSALTTASVEFRWMNGWSAAGTFEGEFSSVTASYAGKGVVRYAW